MNHHAAIWQMFFITVPDWSCWWVRSFFLDSANKGWYCGWFVIWHNFYLSILELLTKTLMVNKQNINSMANLKRTQFGKVDLDYVLGIGGFDLERYYFFSLSVHVYCFVLHFIQKRIYSILMLITGQVSFQLIKSNW